MEGNLMKMREVLVIAMKAICHHTRANHTCDSLAWENSTINANCGDVLCAHRDLCEAKTAIQKALSEPARNCDFGTADEQLERFRQAWTNAKNGMIDRQSLMMLSEYARWSQQKYEEGDAE